MGYCVPFLHSHRKVSVRFFFFWTTFVFLHNTFSYCKENVWQGKEKNVWKTEWYDTKKRKENAYGKKRESKDGEVCVQRTLSLILAVNVSLQKLEEQDRKALNTKEQLQREHRYLKRRLEQLSVSGSVERIRTDSMGSTISTDSEQGTLVFKSQPAVHYGTLFYPKSGIFVFWIWILSSVTTSSFARNFLKRI